MGPVHVIIWDLFKYLYLSNYMGPIQVIVRDLFQQLYGSCSSNNIMLTQVIILGLF